MIQDKQNTTMQRFTEGNVTPTPDNCENKACSYNLACQDKEYPENFKHAHCNKDMRFYDHTFDGVNHYKIYNGIEDKETQEEATNINKTFFKTREDEVE